MNVYYSPAGRVVPAAAVQWSFARSGGPGGQHVNTTESKAEVRIDLTQCTLDPFAQQRLSDRFGDVIVVTCSEHRSQHRNRVTALQRALERLDGALVVEPTRRPTRPTASSRQRRLDTKRRHSDHKRNRSTRWVD